jgi:hypothetical protein
LDIGVVLNWQAEPVAREALFARRLSAGCGETLSARFARQPFVARFIKSRKSRSFT